MNDTGMGDVAPAGVSRDGLAGREGAEIGDNTPVIPGLLRATLGHGAIAYHRSGVAVNHSCCIVANAAGIGWISRRPT